MSERSTEITNKKGRNQLPWHILRGTLWFGLILLWAAYGICVAAFLLVNVFVDPRTFYNSVAGGEVHVDTNDLHVNGDSLLAFIIVMIVGFALHRWNPLRKLRTIKIQQFCPLWYAGFGLLIAIPLGLALSVATPIEYVRDYAAYLKLAQSLYSIGDYSDISEGNLVSGIYDTVAWRPPGVALLYGLPIRFGVPNQESVWLINSVIAAVAFLFVRSSLRRARGPIYVVAGAGLIVCLTTLPFLLLPIAHLPAFATLALLLLLVPTESRRLAQLSVAYWLLSGILVGLSALFRPNFVVEILVVAGAGLIAITQFEGHRSHLRSGAAVLACVLGLAIAVGPWTVRNWFALHRFVPISTNGGMVFYSSNGSASPSEQGHYTRRLAVQLYEEVPDEVDRDHEGWRRGWANIAEHPVSFAVSFLYRVPRLFANIVFPINYIRDQASDRSWIWIFPLFETAILISFWCFWYLMFSYRRSIRERIFDPKQIPWPQFSLLLAVLICLMFNNSPTFQLSFLPFELFIWFDARAISSIAAPGRDLERWHAGVGEVGASA
jgi:hypothetical protein